jgi:hypothetical protein
MRRFVAIGAAALIVVLTLSVCCLASMPVSHCCKGHCAMARTSPPVFAIAPARTTIPPLVIVAFEALHPREPTLLAESDATITWQRLDPIITIPLRI